MIFVAQKLFGLSTAVLNSEDACRECSNDGKQNLEENTFKFLKSVSDIFTIHETYTNLKLQKKISE